MKKIRIASANNYVCIPVFLVKKFVFCVIYIAFFFLTLSASATTNVFAQQPDLVVSLVAPSHAKPGQELRDEVSIRVGNIGKVSAEGSSPESRGYMVDLLLSTDELVPTGFGTPSDVFSEDVLLLGGRISNTPTLLAGESVNVQEGGYRLPKEIPAGSYFLCAQVDPGEVIQESDENNNSACVPLQIGDRPHTTLPDVSLKLDKVVYKNSESVNVTLTFNGVEPTSDQIQIVLAAPATKDVEPVMLTRQSPRVYVSIMAIPIAEIATGVNPSIADGVLSVTEGDVFHGMYYVDPNDAQLANLGAKLYSSTGFLERLDSLAAVILPELALTDNEATDTGKPVGTLFRKGELPVQVATDEVMFWGRNDNDLQDFLALTGGVVLAESGLEPADQGESYKAVYLIRVVVPDDSAERLPMLEAFAGEDLPMLGSNEAALGIVSYVMQLKLAGYPVAVNPRLQYQGAPTISIHEDNEVTHTMQNRGSGGSENCLPNDPSNPCIENVPSLWAFMALFGADKERVNVAVLDMGFATNADYRAPNTGSMVECDMTNSPVNCGPEAAQGKPNVGNSFFGGRSWHGSGVVQTMGGVVNNGEFAAGVAGQVAVPMLYKYDTIAYAFEIGAGIRQAVSDGASCINVSGGYPCRILTEVGPDFNICTVAGRIGLCGVVTASTLLAVEITCAATALIPIFGWGACAIGHGILAAEVGVCLLALTFGNVASPMQSAIRHAAHEGVPVVTVAGNVLSSDKLPPIIRDFVDLENRRTEDWGMMPAMARDAIVVGAVDNEFNNKHFIGNRVDIWAPINSTYFAPEDVNNPASALVKESIGGTSAAAPFITGVIASMQAINPKLNPRNPKLNDSQKESIVGRIKAILTDDANSFTNAELVALGFSNDPERRRLVDPLKAVQAAGAARQGRGFAHSNFPTPDLGSLGYDTTLGFSERSVSDDTPASARTLSFGVEETGSIISILDPAGFAVNPDEDWFEITMPASQNGRPQEAIVSLTQLSRADGTVLPKGETRPMMHQELDLGDIEFTDRFSVLSNGKDEESIKFSIKGERNVYKVKVDTPQPAAPEVEILQPIEGFEACLGDAVPLQADAYYPSARIHKEYADLVVPESEITWSDSSGALTTGLNQSLSFTEGDHTVTVVAFGDSNLSDTVSFKVISCENVPSVSITTPSANVETGFDGFDDTRNQWYKDFLVTATATDPQDGTLSGASLVWKTDMTDAQAEILGTGSPLFVRLYSKKRGQRGQSIITHTIRVEATDSDGNPTTSAPRKIKIADEIVF
jgi:Subtilase family